MSVDLVWLMCSLALLWLGFYFSAMSWRKALQVHGVNISPAEAVSSHGISVLGKYIPGKVWVILGRAVNIARDEYPVSFVFLVSLKEQLLYIFLGLLISFIPVVFYYPLGYVTLILFATALILGLFLFAPAVNRFGMNMLSRIFRKEISLPVLSLRKSAGMAGAIMIYWAFWTGGFYFFLLAVNAFAKPVQAFAFPLSVCYGVMAIIFPGGLGVREGVMVGFLILTGMPVETATSVSVVNRLWFITGELFIFIFAAVLKNRRRKR